jgi:hypothetical protein
MRREKTDRIEIITADYPMGIDIEPFLITTDRVPEDPDNGEVLKLPEKYVVGPKSAVRDLIEYLAKSDFPDLEFTWNRASYDSEPRGGKIVHMHYERVSTIEGHSIYAVVLPLEKGQTE